MMNSKDLFRDLKKQIKLVQEASETESMAYLILEHTIGMTRSDILAEKTLSLTPAQTDTLSEIMDRVNKSEPVQYVLGSAHFYGREFLVNPSVLIPRPETEVLVAEAIRNAKKTPGKILDIGTGSGCIAITLAKELLDCSIIAYDISSEALKTAAVNAEKLSASVKFKKVDILAEPIAESDLDIIVSNPPYVAVSEKSSMNANVLEYEPHLALFVPDTDPLVFYNVIAEKGLHALKPGGKVLVEINERFGKEVCDIFIQTGFANVRVIKDLQNKDRIVSAALL